MVSAARGAGRVHDDMGREPVDGLASAGHGPGGTRAECVRFPDTAGEAGGG